MRRKILHLIPELSMGGAERLLADTVSLFEEFEHRIVVFQSTTPELHINAPVVRLEKKVPRQFRQTVTEINKVVKEFQPDLINAHLYWPVVLIRFCNTTNIPVLTWYHSEMYTPSNREQYSLLRLWVDKLSSKRNHHRVYVSHHLKNTISQQLGIRNAGYVQHNFVGEHFFRTDTDCANRTSRTIKLLTVGNLREQKNQITLLYALQSLPEGSYELKIIGDGPEKNRLMGFVEAHEMTGITFMGRSTEVKKHLCEADIFIMPSLYEGFGISLLEAMASKVACIVSDIPVFREIGGASLVYFNPNEPDDLAEKIISMREPHDRREYAEKAQRQAKNFAQEAYKKRVFGMYGEVWGKV